MIRIQCIRRERELDRLKDTWSSLLRQSASDSIFLTWEWVSNWWAVFGSGFELRVLAARAEDGQILGIAPLMVDRRRRLLIIGQSGGTRAECLDFFVRRGQEKRVTELICYYITHQLADDFDSIFFERVLKSSPNLTPMLNTLDSDLFRARLLLREEVAPYLELATGWDQLLAAKNKKFRNQWRNSCRRLRKRGEPKFLLAGKDLPFDEAFAHLKRLNRKRWGDRGASFRTEEYLRFHSTFGRQILQQGWLCLLLMFVDGSAVAASYDFVYGGKMWGIQGGWDTDFQHERVGTLILGKAIQWGIEHGQDEYDFLCGNYPHKQRWASSERTMAYLEVVRRNRSADREANGDSA